MEEIIKFELTKNEAELLQAALDELLTAMDRSFERMAKDQAEIDQLRVEMRNRLQRDWRGGVKVERILNSLSARTGLE